MTTHDRQATRMRAHLTRTGRTVNAAIRAFDCRRSPGGQVSRITRRRTTCDVRSGENYLYVFKGARGAPGPDRSPLGAGSAKDRADPGAAHLLLCHGRPFKGKRCALGRRQPLLGPPGHGGVGTRVIPPQPPHWPGIATISAKRDPHERAILPALQCEAGARSPARALRVTRDDLRSPLRVILPRLGSAPVGGRANVENRHPGKPHEPGCAILGKTSRPASHERSSPR
jgi:hypothetical protein